MKIGILTLPLQTNYGGILQAYALQTVLERMGHEVSLIEKKKRLYGFPLWKAPLVYGKRMIFKVLSLQAPPIFYEQKYKPLLSKNTDRFINKYIKRRIVANFDEIKDSDYDAVVVGSDQVWRPQYFKLPIEIAYLNFAKEWDIKRIAYAASFGTDEWEYNQPQTNNCKHLIKIFDAVSVREKSGVRLCKDYLGVAAEHLLDPTLLLSPEDYIQLFKNSDTPQSPGTLLTYILDESDEKQQLINIISKERNLIPFRANSRIENKKAPLAERVQPLVEQWLRGFYDAEFVVTDSFHACVFSIIFGKPFIAIGNKERGMARFESLLSTLGLQKNLIADTIEYSPLEDYTIGNNVKETLAGLRQMSISFLQNSLE